MGPQSTTGGVSTIGAGAITGDPAPRGFREQGPIGRSTGASCGS